MHFGYRLKQLREAKGISQWQLAKKLGYVTNSYISDIENGVFLPSEDKLKKIAKALGVPYKIIEDMKREAKLEELGIKDKELIQLAKDLPNLTKKEKQELIKTYAKIKSKREHNKNSKRD
jgi:transcriptional regulator with XRE-family HTH domain